MSWKFDQHVRPDLTLHTWPAAEERQHVLRGTSCECITGITTYPSGATLVRHQLLGSPSQASLADGQVLLEIFRPIIVVDGP